MTAVSLSQFVRGRFLGCAAVLIFTFPFSTPARAYFWKVGFFAIDWSIAGVLATCAGLLVTALVARNRHIAFGLGAKSTHSITATENSWNSHQRSPESGATS